MTLDQRARDAAITMREKLDAITIPEPAAVLRRARRRRLGGGALAIVAVASTVALIAGVAGSGSAKRIEVTGQKPHPSPAPTTGASHSRFTLDPRARGCFVMPSTPDAAAALPTIGHDTTVSPRLLVLADDGALWVIDGDKATLWSPSSTDAQYSGIVWARWLTDGTILTARVGHADVELDKLSAPNQPVPVAHLSYTAPARVLPGQCILDGYPATFAVVDAGVVLLNANAGLLCMGMGGATGATGPQTPCGSQFFPELRSPRDLSVIVPRGNISASQGGTVIASASRAANTIVIDGRTATAMIVDAVGDKCCFGGQTGTAYTVSPDGHQLAYVSDSDRQEVRVAGIGYLTGGGALDSPLWKSPNRIKAMAWTNDTLAVAHGPTISLVTVPTQRAPSRPPTGTVVGEINFNSAIRTMDFQPQP